MQIHPYDRALADPFRDRNEYLSTYQVTSASSSAMRDKPYAESDPRSHVDRMIRTLVHRAPAIDRRWNYIIGNHPMPEAVASARIAYWRLMRNARSNWMPLIVDAVAERLQVVGLRSGGSSDSGAWETWKSSHLDTAQDLVHHDMLALSRSFVMVQPDGVATVESPREVVCEYEPGRLWEPVRALKAWHVGSKDDKPLWQANLYTPDALLKFQGTGDDPAVVEWKQVEEGETGGRVPITEFRNRMNTTGECRSEIDDVIDIQDRINTTLFHRLLASQFAAHKQKWATGLEIPDDPTTGEPVEPFKEAVDRLWVAEDPDVTFGQFEGTDLSPYISSVESDIQHLAAITRTPPHYLLGQSGAFPSGESLKSTETGLVAKSRRRQRFTDPSWTRVIELQTGRRVEIVWADPESRTEGELVDSLTKMATLGVPLKALWERYGASPEQQDDWERQLRTQALNAQGLDLAALGAEPQA